jgi:hypothetical protein
LHVLSAASRGIPGFEPELPEIECGECTLTPRTGTPTSTTGRGRSTRICTFWRGERFLPFSSMQKKLIDPSVATCARYTLVRSPSTAPPARERLGRLGVVERGVDGGGVFGGFGVSVPISFPFHVLFLRSHFHPLDRFLRPPRFVPSTSALACAHHFLFVEWRRL